MKEPLTATKTATCHRPHEPTGRAQFSRPKAICTRSESPAGRTRGSPLRPSRARVALEAFTAGSAYVNHDEDGGSLQVGCRADLALLDRNVFTAGAGAVADARVDMTVASGKVVYERSA
jgi:predicted amidohydrolase YtcJ